MAWEYSKSLIYIMHEELLNVHLGFSIPDVATEEDKLRNIS